MTKYTITIDSELWQQFKRTVAKDTRMNDVIAQLIKKRVEETKLKGGG